MRLIALLATALLAAITLLVAPVAAQNLLTNPDFDLDPTVLANGWSTTGTGALLWNDGKGDPSPPSARTDQSGTERMILFQCVAIVGGASYNFSARSYTHASTGPATNGVSLSVFPTVDCSGDPIENVPTNQESFPNFALRERIGYVTPGNARSARIELLSDANGTMNDISWDNIMVDGPPVPVEDGTWGAIKALYR
jgi:hypothetical protein